MFFNFFKKNPKIKIPIETPKTIPELIKINSFYILNQKMLIWNKSPSIENLFVSKISYRAKENDVIFTLKYSEDFIEYYVKCLINETIGWFNIPKNAYNHSNINELLKEI